MSPGVEGARALAGIIDAANRGSRAWQAEQIRSTGFATNKAELGHRVIATLREQGYGHTVAAVGGHLAAVGSQFNWQGNLRLGQIIGRSERTVQRARAALEADGLITSHLLLTGDMIDGQRAPVRHPQVVRDVSRLQRLAHVHSTMRQPARRRPSVADAPPPVDERIPEPASADDFRAFGEAHPEYAAFFGDMAQTVARRTPPPNAAPVTPEEVDEVERELAETDRRLQHERERGPPGGGRGPPN